MPLLSVNVDLVGAAREARRLPEPDPAQAAVLAELAGADGITVQLRRDRRTVERALEVKPWLVTLVADHADSSAPVSPIDFDSAPVDFGEISSRFTAVGVNVCFFVEPDTEQIKRAARAGASAVLINATGYTHAATVEEAQSELDRIDRALQFAAKTDIAVHCGRGITYKNVTPLVELGMIDEFVVGYAICARAMLVGFDRAVREMIDLLRIPQRQA
jgi:pyridoxine 5-phosphate synthase